MPLSLRGFLALEGRPASTPPAVDLSGAGRRSSLAEAVKAFEYFEKLVRIAEFKASVNRALKAQ